ncbi:hypothetical protein [Shewanella maritima]|uniref:hypothetical protein n=1 Tax=Shewanella maritima TaxID=2520507 RepID=UPI00373578D8
MRLTKSLLPFIALVIISVWWSYYYLGDHYYNDFGTVKSELYLLIDGLLVLPLVCWLCIDDRQQAILKIAAYSCLIVLLGSWIIPQQEQLIWHYLTQGRYVILAAFVAFEVVTMCSVIWAVKGALQQAICPDLAMLKPISRFFGQGIIAKVMAVETRVWSYALFANRINMQAFAGQQHFTYHHKDGMQSHLLGFIVIIAFEVPLAHLLLHFLWSPMAANVVTALTIISLVFFIGEYRACSRRPISIDQQTLLIRFGVWNVMVVPISQIKAALPNQDIIHRGSGVKRFNGFGAPNVHLSLASPIDGCCHVYLGVDQPALLIKAINHQQTQLTPAA